jgi:hypothetical protein
MSGFLPQRDAPSPVDLHCTLTEYSPNAEEAGASCREAFSPGDRISGLGAGLREGPLSGERPRAPTAMTPARAARQNIFLTGFTSD